MGKQIVDCVVRTGGVSAFLKLGGRVVMQVVKFIYSEKATTFCEIFTLLLSHVVLVKSKVKISQNFVAFSEYMSGGFTAGGSFYSAQNCPPCPSITPLKNNTSGVSELIPELEIYFLITCF